MSAARTWRRRAAVQLLAAAMLVAGRSVIGCWQTDLAGVLPPEPSAGSGGAPACQPGSTPCGDACVLLSQDPANCGACGTVCGSGNTCVAGVCACGPGLVSCGPVCVDTSASNDDCGACGNVCTGGSSCVTGTCACPSGESYCSGLCVDTKISPQHCGACGKACPPSKTCAGGVCN